MTKKLRERWKQESHQMILDTPADDTKKSADFMIYKTDEDQRLVFGWASVAITVDGKELEDMQHDMIDPEDLEEAAYEYVLNFRDTGEEHLPGYRKKGRLVESCVFTPEKQKAMGIPEGTLPVAWWIGFKIDDNDTWQRVKNGTYRMFSIEGKAEREEVQKAAYDEWLEENMDKFSSEEEEIKFREWKSPGGFRARTASDVDEIDMQWDEYKRTVLEKTQKARTFDEILKFNPYHGVGGRFASANTATSMTVFTNSPAGQKAIANIRDRELAAMGAGGGEKQKDEAPKKYKKISQKEALEMAKEMGQDDIYKTDPDAGELDGYFQTGASFSLNRALREGINPMTGVHDLSEQQRNTIEVMDRNMKPASRDIKVTRFMSELPDGMNIKFVDLFDETAHPIQSQLDSLVGKVPVNKGYTSTSFDEKYNVFKGNPVKMNINVPKGAPMLISPKRTLSTGDIAEAEIALARGTAMKITGAKTVLDKWGSYQIILECDVLLD